MKRKRLTIRGWVLSLVLLLALSLVGCRPTPPLTPTATPTLEPTPTQPSTATPEQPTPTPPSPPEVPVTNPTDEATVLAGKKIAVQASAAGADGSSASDGQSSRFIGRGSYTTTLPAGRSGPSNANGNPVTPKVTGDFTGTIPTNDWWSSLIWQYYPDNPYSEAMFPHPLALRAWSDGLGVSYPTYVALNNEYHYHFNPEDIRIGVSGLSAPDTRVAAYSDWTVTARWSDGAKTMEATFGHGLPFVYVTKSGGDAVISITSGPEQIWYNNGGVVGLRVNGHYYGVFGPSGSTWNVVANPFGPLTSTLNGENYFSVAILPDNSTATLEYYRKHAYAFVTDTRVSWSYDESTASLTTTYMATTVLKESGSSNVSQSLMALYRHQWLNTSDPPITHTYVYTYVSPRGEMRVLEGLSFSTRMVFNGVIPALPNEGTYDRNRLYGYVDDVYTSPPYVSPADTYWEGKAVGRLAQLVWIADQVGHTQARDAFLGTLKDRLEDWLDADAGSSLFYYDSTWDTLIGYPSSFGTDTQLNDHDFHLGYWIMAAATVAHYDSSWADDGNWGGMVKILIQDVANADHRSTMFPFLRSYDPYAGHNWASGHANFASGNNEESSSEAMNFATGVILWGAATGDTKLRDLGIFLYTNIGTAIQQYWFDVDEQVFPVGYDYGTLGILWSNGGAYATWWTANPEEIHGINFLPLTGGSLYLGHDPDYVTRNYGFMVDQNGGQEEQWKDIIWSFQAFTETGASAAAAKFGDGNYTPEAGESKAHTYHWLHNLNALGQVNIGVTADVPTYAVFSNACTKTYVVYNPEEDARVVHFSDGKVFVVPVRSMSSDTVYTCRAYMPLILRND